MNLTSVYIVAACFFSAALLALLLPLADEGGELPALSAMPLVIAAVVWVRALRRR